MERLTEKTRELFNDFSQAAWEEGHNHAVTTDYNHPLQGNTLSNSFRIAEKPFLDHLAALEKRIADLEKETGGVGFFYDDPTQNGMGFDITKSEETARAGAEECFEGAQDEANGEPWDENVTGIRWGRIVTLGQVVEVSRRPANRTTDPPGIDEIVEYELQDIKAKKRT